ncbi:MAG TPA: DUF3089 domain-containing protein [Bacteroidetes bacterium]|nr:DUF3089 domain-containing protein [Bacteroidota bacterium]
MNFITTFFRSARKAASSVQKWKSFARSIKPQQPFDSAAVPAPYDYSSLESWAAHPAKKSKALLVPPGEQLAAAAMADVFFVHPTTYFGKDNWNQPSGYQPATELLDEMVLPAEASVFNGCCRVFAPRYRQGTFYSFLHAGKNAAEALQVAYTDVERAFRHYLAHFNNDRPFFLAGHSQGTLHLIRLLEEVMDPEPKWVRQMVAAYPIGFQFPMDKFNRTLKNIGPATSPTDLHAVVAWDTFGARARPKSPLDRTRHFYPDKNRWELRYKKKNFGVNPLTFTTSPQRVEAAQNLGAVYVEYANPFRFNDWWSHGKTGIEAVGLSAPCTGEVSAELRPNGFVHISEPKHRQFKMALMPGNNYHNYDYSLFYMNLRKNIGERLDNFLQYTNG